MDGACLPGLFFGLLVLPAVSAGSEPPAATDCDDDPLPPGASARLGTTRFRAGAGILALAYAPDGKLLATAQGDGDVRLWDSATGRQVRLLTLDRGNARALAFARDGKTLAVGLSTGVVGLWDVATGRQRGAFQRSSEAPFQGAHGGEVRQVAFSLDGKRLATGSQYDQAIRLWEVATRRQLREFPHGGGELTGLAFADGGKLLVRASQADDVALSAWEVATGKQRYGLRGHGQSKLLNVEALAVSPDGGMLATTGLGDPRVRLWDAATGRELRCLAGHTATVHRLAFAPDGKLLVSGGAGSPHTHQDATVRVWDVGSGKEVCRLAGAPANSRCLAFTRDSRRVAAAGWDGSVRSWDARTGKEVVPHVGHEGQVACVVVSPDGKVVATAGDKTVRLWDRTTGRELRCLAGHTGVVGSIAFAPAGKLLASAGADGTVRLWDASAGKELRQFAGHRGAVRAVAFAPDSRRLVSGGTDGTTRLWDVATGRELRQLVGRTPGQPPQPRPGAALPLPGSAEVLCVAISPDGRTLAAGCTDYAARVWDVASGRHLAQLASRWTVRTLAYSPDGRTLATGGGDSWIHLWELATGKERLFLGFDGEEVAAVAFSPDGRTLAANSTRPTGEVHLWDVATGEFRGRLQGHRGRVSAVAFTPDGRSLVSGGSDSSALVWDLTDQTPAGRRRRIALTRAELERCWETLANLSDLDGRVPQSLLRLKTVHDQVVPLLRERIKPVVHEKAIAGWIGDLDSKDDAVTRRAVCTLLDFGETAWPALRAALLRKPSPQARQLLQSLFRDGHVRHEAEEKRALNAVFVLEVIDTPAARAVLRKLAGGTPEANLTRRAQEALNPLREGRPGSSAVATGKAACQLCRRLARWFVASTLWE